SGNYRIPVGRQQSKNSTGTDRDERLYRIGTGQEMIPVVTFIRIGPVFSRKIKLDVIESFRQIEVCRDIAKSGFVVLISLPIYGGNCYGQL
ncbi:MAG: hypothetical protein J6Y21_05515, partial [Clostridia bacterium]|nr:hypothetical protein [Clostridia bacterium]